MRWRAPRQRSTCLLTYGPAKRIVWVELPAPRVPSLPGSSDSWAGLRKQLEGGYARARARRRRSSAEYPRYATEAIRR